MILTFGEIMLRLSPSDKGERLLDAVNYRVEPGGSEANVAIALAALGHETCFSTVLPDHDLGNRVMRYLRCRNVDTTRIVRKGDRLGVYWTENGVGPRASNVIYDREASAIALTEPEVILPLISANGVDWFHSSGITAAISPNAFRALLRLQEQFAGSVRMSVDLNFRNKLWGWLNKDSAAIHQHMNQICQRTFLLTGNETDFENALGLRSSAETEQERYAEYALCSFERFEHLQYVAVSLRRARSASQVSWSGLLFRRKSQIPDCYVAPSHLITDIVDRVGTGDSFSAGIIHGLLAFENEPQKVLDFAVGLSALNHTCTGDASTFAVKDVEHFLKTNGSGRIVR